MASRSSSQDCTTEPSLQELITAAGSSTRSDFTMVAKPSPKACIMPVFDAVVHHLGEVAAAHRAGQHQSGIAFRLKCLENRARALEVPLAAANHKRVAAVDAPHAAGDAAIHEMDALRLQFGPRGVRRRCNGSCRRR